MPAQPHSPSPSILGNTTVLAHGSVLDSSLNARVLSYRDFVDAPVTAGFCSFVRTHTKPECSLLHFKSARGRSLSSRIDVVQPGGERYAALAAETQRVVIDLFHQNTESNGPTFIQFLGGPAWGSEALTEVITHFGWRIVTVYYQNDPYDIRTAEAFMLLAAARGLKFSLTMRETRFSTLDEEALLAATSNVFIFFGG